MSAARTGPLARVLREAREGAFAPGEFVGQESFVSAREVLSLARRGGVGPGTDVLDLCCGVGGPGLLVAEELQCTYLGVDADSDSVAEARRRASRRGLPARFAVASVPPVPWGPVDVVLLLETLLAFPDKDDLLHAVASALRVGGRFLCTVEEGRPLSRRERQLMPGSDTVWPVTWPDLVAALDRAGLRVLWRGDSTPAHGEVAGALADAYAQVAQRLPPGPDRGDVERLVVSHRLWSEWLGTRRLRKLAVVAERR